MKKMLSFKSLPLAACTFAALAAVSMQAKAVSVDLRVTGVILPAACTPAVSNNGVIDYGQIAPGTLRATTLTVLPEKTLTFTITCDAQVKMALRAVNGRPGTAAGVATAGSNSDGQAPVSLFGTTATGVAGLGLDGTAKIGGYAMRITPGKTTADSNSVDSLSTTESGTTWVSGDRAGDLYHATDSRIISWGATGTTAPVGITNLSGELSVQAYLNNATELSLSHEIVLDGMSTLELFYL